MRSRGLHSVALQPRFQAASCHSELLQTTLPTMRRGASGAASRSPGARPCTHAGRSAALPAVMAPAALTAALLGGGLLLAAWRWLRAAARPGAGAGASMRGKTVIITGANSGLGRAAATELLRMQARVIMGCRDRARAERAAREIRAELGEREAAEGGGELVVRELDLASLRSVRAFCHRVLQVRPRPRPVPGLLPGAGFPPGAGLLPPAGTRAGVVHGVAGLERGCNILVFLL